MEIRDKMVREKSAYYVLSKAIVRVRSKISQYFFKSGNICDISPIYYEIYFYFQYRRTVYHFVKAIFRCNRRG